MDNIVYNPKHSLAEIRRLQYNSGLYQNFNEINQTISAETLYKKQKTTDSKGNIFKESIFKNYIETSCVGFGGNTYETTILYGEKNRLQTNELKKIEKTRSYINLKYNYDGIPHVFTISKFESLSIVTNKDNGTKTLISDTDRNAKKRFILNNDGNAYLEIR